MLFAEGLPMFLLEMAIGQRMRKGSLGVWDRVSPYWGGIGVASAIVSFNVALYYNTVIAWCLSYFVQSFRFPLPWSYCPTVEDEMNQTSIIQECEMSSSTQYFWYRNTLEISDDVNNPDNFNWPIAACLLAAWCLVYLCIVKGITENPKIIYVTAIYPYVVLIIFFFRGITLEGMEDGVRHLFKPKFEKLADPVVWLEAGTQIFFSLGLAFGGLIAYASYNPVNNNCTKDALIVAFTNCATSMFAGIVIFSIMGFKANQVHKKCLVDRNITLTTVFGADYLTSDALPDNIKSLLETEKGNAVYTDGISNITFPNCNLEEELDNSASGTGLAFILFTEAVNQFPAGNVWAVLFFLMLFTLGLDSQFGTLQGVVQCFIDLKLFPNLRKEILTGKIRSTYEYICN
jgi:solute carrier family 6 amino acid/orphan transporter-like 15/16/17/18/20